MLQNPLLCKVQIRGDKESVLCTGIEKYGRWLWWYVGGTGSPSRKTQLGGGTMVGIYVDTVVSYSMMNIITRPLNFSFFYCKYTVLHIRNSSHRIFIYMCLGYWLVLQTKPCYQVFLLCFVYHSYAIYMLLPPYLGFLTCSYRTVVINIG